AFSFVLANFGIAIAAKIPMITTTIRSSISVKPLRFIWTSSCRDLSHGHIVCSASLQARIMPLVDTIVYVLSLHMLSAPRKHLLTPRKALEIDAFCNMPRRTQPTVIHCAYARYHGSPPGKARFAESATAAAAA